MSKIDKVETRDEELARLIKEQRRDDRPVVTAILDSAGESEDELHSASFDLGNGGRWNRAVHDLEDYE